MNLTLKLSISVSPRPLFITLQAVFIALLMLLAVPSNALAFTQDTASQAVASSTVEQGREGNATDPLAFKQSEFDLRGSIVEVVIYLLVLTVLAVAVVAVMKRRMVAGGALPRKMGERIRLLDRKTLSTRVTLHLVEVDGQRLVITESGSGQVMLELSGQKVESGDD